MAKIVMSDSAPFRDALGAIKDLVPECTMKLNDAGLEITSMDAANVALVQMKVARSEFTEWGIEGETKIRVKLSDLTTILKRASKDSSTSIEIVENKLKIVLGKKEFKLALIDDGDDKEQKVPDLKDMKLVVELTRDAFNDAVEDAALFSESCEFKVEKSKLFVSGKGDTNDSKVEVDGKVSAIVEGAESSRSKFSIEYLKKFGQCKIGKNYRVKLASDYPMILECANEKGSIAAKYILAPRVDNSD